MSYISNIGFRDSAALDAFNRLRVSNPTGLFNSQHQYDTSPLLWDAIVTFPGKAPVHKAHQSSVELSNGGVDSGASSIFQSREYVRYQPAKSQAVFMTFIFKEPVENVVKTAMLGDDQNGLGFRQAGANGYQFFKRSFVTGAAVETVVDQADWNLDRMDGTGPSGVNANFETDQILMMDLEWLGSGRVRMGFLYKGTIRYAHEFNHDNILTSVYITTANLPIRYQIQNVGVAGGVTSMDAICSAVIAEGGFEDDRAYQFGHAMNSTVSAGTTPVAILALRPKLTFGGVTNRGQIVLDEVSVLQDSVGSSEYGVRYGLITGGTWTSVDQHSIAEVGVGIAVPTGPAIIAGLTSGTVMSRAAVSSQLRSRIPIVIGANGTNQYGVTLVARAFTGSNDIAAAFNWREFR